MKQRVWNLDSVLEHVLGTEQKSALDEQAIKTYLRDHVRVHHARIHIDNQDDEDLYGLSIAIGEKSNVTATGDARMIYNPEINRCHFIKNDSEY